MKKLFLLIGLVFFSGSVFGETDFLKLFNIQMEEGGYFEGDPNQNEILESTEDYIVVRNLTAKAKIYIPIDSSYLQAEVFGMEAKKHCSTNTQHTNYTTGSVLDNHTVYLYCTSNFFESLTGYVGHKGMESTKVIILENCFEKRVGSEDYKLWECKELFKWADKKYPNYKKLYKQIQNYERKMEDSSFVFELKKKVLAKANTQQTIDAQQKKMETCSAYGFEVGSEPFGQCIFKLMELDLEYAKLENERLRLQAQADQATLNNQNDLAQSLAIQSMAAAQDKSLRIQQFGLFMKSLQQLTQPTPSPLTPRITCRKFQNTTTCY